LARFWAIRDKASARTGICYPIIVIQEAGLDGFWIHRALEKEGIESHVVDAASIAVSRRRRRAKTDRIDGEALLRVLLAFKRGEPRVCSMARAPTPEAEDRRRIGRERKTLIVERVRHVNRIKGLLFSQGIGDYKPLRRDRREALEAVGAGDGRALGAHMKAQIGRELDRLELLLGQIAAVEAERDALLARQAEAETEAARGAQGAPARIQMLMNLKCLGPDTVAMLWTEAFYRSFDNRRQLAAFVGLAGTPWQSGSIDNEQGVSKGGNHRLRTAMIELAWLWPRHQPGSALARWFRERTKGASKLQKKKMVVALARKLLVALWRYVDAGVVIEGAVLKSAAKAN
jgi:transposase